MRRGFSLVELSIVLVILGLLTGGILAGQSLIRAAEMRSVTTEYQRFTTATQSFRDKYFALPGDFSNATAFWGISTACAGAAATGTCNGNGDGQINFAGGASATGEMFQFWRQLASAGLVEGTYTGVAGAGGITDSTIGTNAPRSRINSGGWAARWLGVYAGDANTYAYDYGNYLLIGSALAGNVPINPLLKPEEAWNIDTKLDDGLPGSGKLIAVSYPTGWYNAGTNPTTCTTSTTLSNLPGAYNLSVSSLQCALLFVRQF